ncbi:peptidase family m48 domain-containing protein [Ditylenchus destructor]|nr:peptidase family m48 domain-containing protein [Ditylenchus destructor]
MTPDAIFWSLIFLYWASVIWDLYLSFRQYKVHLDCAKRPDSVSEIISEEDYDKARLYSLDKHRFGFAKTVFQCLQTTILFIILPGIWELCIDCSLLLGLHGEIWHSIIFSSFSAIASSIVSLPFSLYETFVIEQKHGFNKQTVPFFVKDKVEKLIFDLIITPPFTAAWIWVVLIGGQYLFFYLWILFSIVMLSYPEYIAPRFDKYTPFPPSELKEKIEALAQRVEFPLEKLYVVENSKRSSHSNAYFYGFWKNKGIVLYDTMLSQELMDQLKEVVDEDKSKNNQNESKPDKENTKKHLGMSDDEVIAILAHELGHWKLWHNVKNHVILELLSMLPKFAAFVYLYQHEPLYSAFGFSSKPLTIGFMIIFQFVTGLYGKFVTLPMSFINRRGEFSADRFAAELGYADLLPSALIKTGKKNLSLPVDDHLYSMFRHSQPSIPERIAALKKYA